MRTSYISKKQQQNTIPFWGYENPYIKQDATEVDDMLSPHFPYHNPFHSTVLFAKEFKEEHIEQSWPSPSDSSDFSFESFRKNLVQIIAKLLTKYSTTSVDAINIINEMKELLPSLLLHKIDAISPENFYLQKVSKLPNIEAITYEDLSHIKYFTTILSKRDIDIREHIYDIEMELLTLYPDSQFNFSVTYLRKPNSLGTLIRNKRVLFHKDSIYGR